MNKIRFLNIVELEDGVKEKIRNWRNSERVRSAMVSQHIISKQEHLKWLKSLESNRHKKGWMIFVDNIPIGSIYLENIDEQNLASEWGFYIGEKEYTGKGLAKMILFEFLTMFFDQMEFKTLFTRVLPSNDIALNLYRKFRFREMEKPHIDKDKSFIFFKFTREDWLNTKDELRDESCYKNTK